MRRVQGRARSQRPGRGPAGVLAACALLLGAPAGAARTYTVTTIETFGNVTPFHPTTVNASGQVVGLAVKVNPVDQGLSRVLFMYNGGVAQELPNVPGSNYAEEAKINDAGEIVGYSTISYYPLVTHAFLYRSGTLTDLNEVFGWQWSTAHGINNLGQIVVSGLDQLGDRAVIFSLPDGTMVDIPPPSGFRWLDPLAINDGGQVVGGGSGQGYLHAFLYSNGTSIDLGTLPGALSSEASAINAAGAIAGWSDLVGAKHAVLWSSGEIVDLGTLPGDARSQAAGINASGQVVGNSGEFSCGWSGRAFLYEGGTMYDLNTLIDPALGLRLRGATAINDLGQIAGSGDRPGSDGGCPALSANFSFLLTPTVCGNGEREFGEECDDGAANGTDGCCSATCAVVDTDGDGVCDAADPCTSDAPGLVTNPKLVIGSLGTPPGDDWLRLTGTLAVSPTPPIDPATKGIRIILTGATGDPLLDATVPGGARWTTAPNGTGWRYHDGTGSISGIVRVTLKQVNSTPGLLHFDVRGRRGNYGVGASDLPVTVDLVIDAPVATTGQCAQVDFSGPPPAPSCTLRGASARLRCE